MSDLFMPPATRSDLQRLPVFGPMLLDVVDTWLGLADAMNLMSLHDVLTPGPDAPERSGLPAPRAELTAPPATPERVPAMQQPDRDAA